MGKPHIVKLGRGWWCFDARRMVGKKGARAWPGRTPALAYLRWASFNTMKR